MPRADPCAHPCPPSPEPGPASAVQVKVRSAGVVVLRRDPAGWCCLILRAYRNWDFPKGVVEPGEDPLQAAVREVAEETGISDLAFRWGLDWRETAPYGHGKAARFYIAETRQAAVQLPINPRLGRPEHHEYRWASFAEARALLPARLAEILEWVRTAVKS